MRNILTAARAGALAALFAVALTSGCKPASPDSGGYMEGLRSRLHGIGERLGIGGDKAADAPSRTAIKPTDTKLTALLNLAMLGKPVEHFERIAGAPVESERDGRRYEVEGCTITSVISGGRIVALRVELTDGCRVDLAPILMLEKPAVISGRETFARLLPLIGDMGSFKTHCLSMCGSAFDPNTAFVVEGSHASGFVDVEIGAEPGQAQDGANSAWEEHMRQRAGDDYLMETRFNCDSSYAPFARSAFAAVKAEYIQLGADEYRCE